MKKSFELKIKIDDKANLAIEPAGYIISSRPVTSEFDGKTIYIKEIKRDWLKELKDFIKREGK